MKVDVKNARDVTRDLAPNAPRVGGAIETKWGQRIRGVYCCSDYSSCD